MFSPSTFPISLTLSTDMDFYVLSDVSDRDLDILPAVDFSIWDIYLGEIGLDLLKTDCCRGSKTIIINMTPAKKEIEGKEI